MDRAIRPDAPDLIAIDGKTSKRTGDTRTGQRPLHTLSAYAREQRLVLAQEVVDGKSNEGAMIPSLLDKLRLKGSLVTIDAAGSYRPIAERIVEAGADYLLTVKANQPKLLAGIKAALERAAPETVRSCERAETSHGRQEYRRCTVAPAPAGLGGKTPWRAPTSLTVTKPSTLQCRTSMSLARQFCNNNNWQILNVKPTRRWSLWSHFTRITRGRRAVITRGRAHNNNIVPNKPKLDLCDSRTMSKTNKYTINMNVKFGNHKRTTTSSQ